DLRPLVVHGEGVYVSADGSLSYYGGELAELLFPLLDGARTRDEIVSACTGDFEPDDVRGAIDELVAGGHVLVDTGPPRVAGPDAAFYESHGVQGSIAADRLSAAVVVVLAIGEVDPAPLRDGLEGGGVGDVRVTQGLGDVEGASLGVVATDNYLRTALGDLNDLALRSGTPWLLSKPTGAVAWIGPVFSPGRTACWACLAHRLGINRHEESLAQQRLGLTEPLGAPTGRHRLGDQLASSVVAFEAVRFLAGVEGDRESIVTYDLARTATQRHHVARRPQCAACGDPTLVVRQQLSPVRFESRAKAVTTDGGHRAVAPASMVERFLPQVSPISGVVTVLQPSALPVEGLHVFSAGQNIASMPVGMESAHLGLRSTSSGKGMSEIQAKASALGEAIERSSTMFHGDEPRRSATFLELGDEAIDPGSYLLFSDRQYLHRAIWNLGASQFNEVFEPFRADATMDWSPLWSLSQQRTRWLPTRLIYFACPPTEGRWAAFADSNGCAAGTSLEDATLQGFCELIERDSVALWWYNRVRRPGIDLSTFDDPYVGTVLAAYERLGREVWALDLTSDLGIPAVGAISRVADGPQEDILIAFGAHLDPKVALLRALGEMTQFIAGVHPTSVDGHELPRFDDPTFLRWCETATVANQPYLLPDASVAPLDGTRWQGLAADDLADDLRRCQETVEAAGLELLVVNLTRPDVGLPVVKVVVPGLRHFWPRYAPGRLYDLPVELGWCSTPTPEEELNPFPIFI
ncbi:MAG TPA: TOMM precursor leader peptide-binding protein, partial [Acidimicrobiales bacterium]|nr:TOMM precursor leader peptide-binding protein [Acidimicrobiales bacterium]